MPPRRKKTSPLTLGIAGSGELKEAALVPLLDDLAAGNQIDTIFVPVTDVDYTDEVAAVVKWAKKNDVKYATVSDAAAANDRDLKKVIAAGIDDYESGELAGSAIVELLAGDEDEPVEDGRLLMFFNPEQDEDVVTFEEASKLGVRAFDLCNGLDDMRMVDDEPEAGQEDSQPEEETKPRGRRTRRAAADDGDPGDGPAALADSASASVDRAALEPLTMVELKKRLKTMDPETYTTEALRGKRKDELIMLIVADSAGRKTDNGRLSGTSEDEDEAQATILPLAQEGEEPDDREAVFARLRANRERAEQMAVHLTRSLKAIAEEGDSDEAAERAAAALAASLMLFAEFLIFEVRKPKSPGRPRKDGSEAKPRETTAEEVTPTRRRRRAS